MPPRPFSTTAAGLSAAGGLLLVAAGVAAYASSLGLPRLGTPETAAVPPLVGLCSALEERLFGAGPRAAHGVSLVLHLGAGLALLGLLRPTLLRLGRSPGLALAVALIWLVHPLQTASVTHLAQRADLLTGFLYLTTLLCAVRGFEASSPQAWHLACVALCAAGMSMRSLMLSAPLAVLLYDAAFVAGTAADSLRRRPGLYAGLAASWIALALPFLGGDSSWDAVWGPLGPANPLTYALTETGVLLHYLRLAIWPAPLIFDYAWPLATDFAAALLPALALAGLLALTVWGVQRRHAAGFAGAWFFLILAPTSSFLPLAEPMGEHRMYLPLAALVAGAVLGGDSLLRRVAGPRGASWLGASAVLAAAALFGALTLQRNRDYASEIAFWSDNVAKRPESPRAQATLGGLLARQGQLDRAADHLEAAVRLAPGLPAARYDLGLVYERRDDLALARSELETVLRLVPDHPRAQHKLGTLLEREGDLTGALEHYRRALALEPDFAEAHYNAGGALEKLGQLDRAASHLERALALDPDFAAAHYTLALVLEQRGNPVEAARHYEAALRLLPGHAQAHVNLGVLYAGLGRDADAGAQFETALGLDPASAPAHYNLGVWYQQRGRRAEAAAHYRAALAADPDHLQADENLRGLGRPRGPPPAP